MKKLFTVFLLLALCPIVGLRAQYVTIDLVNQVCSTDHFQGTIDGVTIDYYLSANKTLKGAIISGETWTEMYQMKVSSANGKKIIAIEMDGKMSDNANKGTDLNRNPEVGEWEHRPGATSVWKGSTSSLSFKCATGSQYYVQTLRVWFEGSTYEYVGGEGDTEYVEPIVGERMVRTPSTPQNGVAVKMAIVAARRFEQKAKDYALWKTKQGYDVEEVYADDYNQNGALTGDAWAQAIRQHLIQTRPAFVLIMGDDDHVPPFAGTDKTYRAQSGETKYITDYFYGEFEGNDYFPEAYVGRFSGHNEQEIQNQMDKTKHMAFLPADQGSWLNKALCIVAPDGSDQTIVDADKFARDYFTKMNCTVTPTSPSSTTVSNTINAGCGIVTYNGHGAINSLNSQWSTYHAQSLTNKGMYPVFLAMTCLTGHFDTYTCLAEMMQSLPNAGSVAYIGATRESYMDKLFLTGKYNDGQTYLGFLRSMFPETDDDPLNQHSRTIGEAFMQGRYALRNYAEKYFIWASEYHELFGDPTYMPYLEAPRTMQVTKPASVMAGTAFTVQAAPHSVVCVSTGRTIVAVALADAEGKAHLASSPDVKAGNYTLYCSAPKYTDYETTITLTAFDESGVVAPTFNFNDYARHRVLVEKFTGQQCISCTRAESTMKDYAAQNDERLYEIRHYSYGSDGTSSIYLKMGFHEDLFSAWEFSGHPTYTIDRTGCNGERSVTSDGYKYTAEDIVNKDLVGARWNTPCQLSLSLEGTTYDPSAHLLRVVVSGKQKTELPDLCLNLFLTQNKITAYQTNYGLFEHNGVSRAFLTEKVTGDALTTNEDGTFQKVYYYEVPATLGNYATVLENMDVVAFVSSWDNYSYNKNKDGKDFSNSEVHNVEVMSLKDAPLRARMPQLPGTIQTGDTNGDGIVNIADLTLLIRHLKGQDTPSFHSSAADVDGNGKVTKSDVQALVNKMLKK